MGVLRTSIFYALIFIMTAVQAAAFEDGLIDGVYGGEYSFVSVEVTIEDSEVKDIRMISHGGGGSKYAKMVEPVISEMVKTRSISVDAVTGATVSSENLKKAVDIAVSKARK
jgi:NosR/NirI family transcriptional regulator, nitrous oxide reductase regulator